MADDNFGIRIGIEGEKDFMKAFSEINQNFKLLGSEMNLVSSQFDKQDKSIQAVIARNEVLNKEIDAQKDKITTLEAALKNAAESFGENDKRTQAWQVQLNNANADLNKMEKELEESADSADNLGNELKEAGESIQKTGEEAYKNLRVSQSAYLATANKMGALFQGSGAEQQKSLELTEKAMQRAADMASVMGIDMQVALDSVAGAAKGNFTMMDNLGVAMNATNIEAYALAKGLDFTWASANL